MMRKLFLIVVGLAFIFAFSVTHAANKHMVTIYTSMYEDIIKAMAEVLHKKFPNYDVQFFYGSTGTLQAKIAAERDTKKLGCDMLMLADPSYALELKAAGILHRYISRETANIALEYDPEGYWYPVRNLIMVLAYNPQKFKKADLARSFREFAWNPSLQGAISMPNPLKSGTALVAIAALKDKYGYEYFDKLAANKVLIAPHSEALRKLETGECKEIMILEESVLKKREEEHSSLEVIYPSDGIISIPSPILTINDAWSAHGNAYICEELTDWFLSEEGQGYIVKGWMHSVLNNPPAIPYDSISTVQLTKNTMPVYWKNYLGEHSEIRTNFENRLKGKRSGLEDSPPYRSIVEASTQ